MRYLTLMLIITLLSCHTSINHGRNGLIGPDKDMDCTLTSITSGITKEYKHIDVDYNVEISDHSGQAKSIIGLGIVRKELGLWFIESGVGLGIMDRDTAGVVRGPHFSFKVGTGIKYKRFKFKIGFDHRCNPVRKGDDGDVGENFITGGIEWTW